MKTKKIYQPIMIGCIVVSMGLSGCNRDSNNSVADIKPTEIVTTTVQPTPIITLEPTVKPTQEPEIPIVFKDPEFESLIRTFLDKKSGDITQKDLDSIKEFCVYEKQLIPPAVFFSDERGALNQYLREQKEVIYDVKDWSDLALLKNLKRLVLDDCGLTDIKSIVKLTSLEYLDIQSNEIEDYSDIVQLTQLRELYMGLDYDVEDKSYLYDLTMLQDSDIWWDAIYKPTIIYQEDEIQGITSGNLTNHGFVTCDGTNIYTCLFITGDMAYGNLVTYDTKVNSTTYFNCPVTKEMAEQWGYDIEYDEYTDIKDYIELNDDIYCLNLYDHKLYYISKGYNQRTCDLYDNGTYYPGDDLLGIITIDLATKEIKLVTTDDYQLMCVARNHIYTMDEKGHFYEMTLEGKNRNQVTKQLCSFIYVNEDEMYYVTKDKKKLYRIQNGKEECILSGNINAPIFQGEDIFYLDDEGKLYRWNDATQETKCICEDKIRYYNVDHKAIYACICTQICRLDFNFSDQQVLLDDWNNSYDCQIQIVGDYLFVGKWWDYIELKKDGSIVNDFVRRY